MKIRNFILFIILIIQSCALDCREIRDLFLPKEYHFEITKKKMYQYVILEGIYCKKKQLINFKEGDYWAIYDSIHIGDILIKPKGSTDIILVKTERGDSVKFEMFCDGKPMWWYE